MKSLLLPFALLSISLLASAGDGDAAAQAHPSIDSLLPAAGERQCALMKLAFDKSAEDITKRFNEAVAKKPKWLAEYIKGFPKGTPIAYHPNFGISEEEYGKMLESFKSRHLEKLSDLGVSVKRAGDGQHIELDFANLPASSLAWAKFDAASMTLSTPQAEFSAKPEFKISSDPQSPFGDWQGYVWEFRKGEIKSGEYLSAQLTLGTAKGSENSFIAYRLKGLHAGKVSSNMELILMFKPSVEKAGKDGR